MMTPQDHAAVSTAVDLAREVVADRQAHDNDRIVAGLLILLAKDDVRIRRGAATGNGWHSRGEDLRHTGDGWHSRGEDLRHTVAQGEIYP